MSSITPFRNILTGTEAFYSDHNKYLKSTQKEFESLDPLAPSYIWTPPGGKMRKVKKILSYLIFPLLIYKLFHCAIGSLILHTNISKEYAQKRRLQCFTEHKKNKNRPPITSDFKYKRFTIQVKDGISIDCLIMGRPSTLNNQKWLLQPWSALGYNEQELGFYYSGVKSHADHLDSNLILYNYPGTVGKRWRNRDNLREAHQAVLNFLTDKENGIGAKEIITLAYCLGGYVHDDALKSAQIHQDVRYVNIWDRVGASLSKLVNYEVTTTVSIWVGDKNRICKVVGLILSKIAGFVAGALVKLSGWDIQPGKISPQVRSIKNIIVQTVTQSPPLKEKEEPRYRIFTNPEEIVDDNLLLPNNTFAKRALEDPQFSKENLTCIGISQNHFTPLDTPGRAFLANQLK